MTRFPVPSVKFVPSKVKFDSAFKASVVPVFVITLLSDWFATDTPDKPVKFEPSPTNDVAVHTPVANISPSLPTVTPDPTFISELALITPPIVVIPDTIIFPSTLILAATPGLAPTSIPFLAVTKPTESIFVTSSYVRVPPMDRDWET